MSDILREFLVAVGFKADDNSARKTIATADRVEKAVSSADQRTTQVQTVGSARRIIVANREAGVRTQGAAAIIGSTRRIVVSDADRLKAEQRSAEMRTKLHQSAVALVTGLATTTRTVAAAVIGSSAALATAAIGATTVVERMSAGLERLYYAGQRTNTSAKSLQAFGYAAAQMGSSAEEAIGSVEELARKMRESPGYESMLKGLGVSTRNGQGKLREGTDLLLQLGDAFKKMPFFQQKAYADALGMPEKLLMTLTSGDLRKNIDKYNAMVAMAGLNPDDATKKSKAFMDIWRDMSAGLSIVATKIEGALVDKFGVALQSFTTWLLNNSDRISAAVIKIGETLLGWAEKLGDLFTAFEKLDPQTKSFLIQIGALIAALLLLKGGPIAAILALTAALAGNDGMTAAMAALGAVLALKVLAPLTQIMALMTGLGSIRPPAWLLGLLGVGALAGAANASGILTGPEGSRSVGEGILRTLDPGLADRVYGPTQGGQAADAKDKRNLWQKYAPKVLGGKDAPVAVGGGSSAPLGPAPAGLLDNIARAEGTYRTGYNTSLGHGRYLPGGKEQDLQSKSLNEILELGNDMRRQPGNPNSSALGRYQIVGSTLRAAMKALSLDPETTKFDAATQDKMGHWIARKQGLGAWEGFKNHPAERAAAAAAMQRGDSSGGASPAAPVIQIPANFIPKIESGSGGIGVSAGNPFSTMPLGSWSNANTSTTNNITMSPQMSVTVSGAGDAKATAETIGQHQTRVHADLLRNLQGAVA